MRDSPPFQGVLQTVITQRANTSSSRDKLQDVKEKLVSNGENIERLTNNLSEDNLAKTRTFADMLAADRTLAGNAAKLNEVKDRRMVNELHIIDEDGIITGSTIEAYVGLDMKRGEQSNAFMVIMDDPSIELVQEPQVNSGGEILARQNPALIGTPAVDAAFPANCGTGKCQNRRHKGVFPGGQRDKRADFQFY